MIRYKQDQMYSWGKNAHPKMNLNGVIKKKE